MSENKMDIRFKDSTLSLSDNNGGVNVTLTDMQKVSLAKALTNDLENHEKMGLCIAILGDMAKDKVEVRSPKILSPYSKTFLRKDSCSCSFSSGNDRLEFAQEYPDNHTEVVPDALMCLAAAYIAIEMNEFKRTMHGKN